MREFFRVNIEITNICNLQCSFCPEVIRTKKLIDVNVFRQIIGQVAPITKQVALHLMGEPLAHPQFDKILDICGEYGVEVFLVSNGILLREKMQHVLLHPSLRQISFSLHSFIDNYPNRDPGSYLDSIFRFTELVFEKRPTLFINYRLWNLDKHRENDLNSDLLKRIEQRFGVPFSGQLTGRMWKVKLRLSVHFDSEFIWPSLDLPVLGMVGTCHGLTSHFGLLVDGTVVPCCLDKEGVLSLGNILEQPIREIFQTPRARKMVQGFEANQLVEDLCQRCNFIDRFQDEKPRATRNVTSQPSPLHISRDIQS